MTASQGSKFWAALDAERPLQVAGAVNAYSAILAAAAGFRAIYLSGSGVATASYGLPDLGITTLDNVAEDVRRITGAVDLPLLVDADTGWGAAFMIARTVRELSRAGAAGIHWRTRSRQSGVDIGPASNSSRLRRWPTVLRLLWTRGRTPISL